MNTIWKKIDSWVYWGFMSMLLFLTAVACVVIEAHHLLHQPLGTMGMNGIACGASLVFFPPMIQFWRVMHHSDDLLPQTRLPYAHLWGPCSPVLVGVSVFVFQSDRATSVVGVPSSLGRFLVCLLWLLSTLPFYRLYYAPRQRPSPHIQSRSIFLDEEE